MTTPLPGVDPHRSDPIYSTLLSGSFLSCISSNSLRAFLSSLIKNAGERGEKPGGPIIVLAIQTIRGERENSLNLLLS